jgi:hypothetical protein
MAADNVSQSFGGTGPSFDEHLEQLSGQTGGEDWLGLVVASSARVWEKPSAATGPSESL